MLLSFVCVEIQQIVCCRWIRAPVDVCFVQSVKHDKLDSRTLVWKRTSNSDNTTNWNQLRTSGVIHRFIATVLFRMVKDWPHSSGNINEWPVNSNAGSKIQIHGCYGAYYCVTLNKSFAVHICSFGGTRSLIRYVCWGYIDLSCRL